MIIGIEIFVCLCLFTLMVLIMAKDPIKTLYNYPPKVQEKVKSMPEYQGMIPTTKNQIVAKVFVSLFIVIFVSLILRYVNNCTSFIESLFTSYLIWTVVNVYDVLILDFCWFCQSDKFVFPNTEDIRSEYKNYWFHLKEGFIGQILGLFLCILISLVVLFI